MKKIISTIVISLFAAFAAFAAPPAKKAAPAPARPAPAPVRPAPAMQGNANTSSTPGHNNANANTYGRQYGMAGCGLGSIVIGNKGGQIWAATTNATAYSQLFGITSGTSNCVESATSAKADRMDKYIVVNKIALADDIARGEGETIQGLAQIMNCSQADQLGAKLQSKFTSIFPSHDLEANEITDRIITVVGQDEVLANACGVTIVSSL
jgi:hypothetical protein